MMTALRVRAGVGRGEVEGRSDAAGARLGDDDNSFGPRMMRPAVIVLE